MNVIFTIIFLLSFVACTQENTKPDEPKIDTESMSKMINKILSKEKPTIGEDKYSYLMGHSYITEALKDTNFNFNTDYFILGALQALDKSSEDMFTEADLKRIKMELEKFMQETGQRIQEKELQKFYDRGDKFKAMHNEFIAKYLKDHPNSKRTPSGVIYEKIRDGVGPFPQEKDFLTILSNGFFMDGEQFDNSLSTGQPKQFMLNQIFPGLKEIVEIMNKGARYKVVIPYELAFGEEGAHPQFPPFATLVMQVELVKIDKLPESGGGMEMPEGVKIKDVRQKRVSAPPRK
jgi:FKBP-type peptidyl-prolyl cis-trans isomerase